MGNALPVTLTINYAIAQTPNILPFSRMFFLISPAPRRYSIEAVKTKRSNPDPS